MSPLTVWLDLIAAKISRAMTTRRLLWALLIVVVLVVIFVPELRTAHGWHHIFYSDKV